MGINFETINPGDEVGMSSRWLCHVVKVVRKTATQLVVDGGHRFNKHLRLIGSGSRTSRSYLITVAEANERIAEESRCAARMETARFLREYEWSRLSDEQLAKIKEFVTDMESAEARK